MKRILITLTLFFSVIAASFAQAPQKFSYQAVVRNESNTLVRGTVGVRVSILQGGVNGTVVYQESHITTTNANGLMTLEIGGGSLLSGDFATINWANGPYFLKTETDPYGGTNYIIEGTQQLLSVPYALYAGSAANSFSGSYNDLTDLPQMPDIPTNVSAFNNDAGYITMDSVPEIPTNVSAFTNDAGYITANDVPLVPSNVSAFNNDAGYITANDVPLVPANVSAFTNDAGYITANDVPAYQVLSISNDTIFLSNGGYAVLPAGFDGDYNSLTNRPDLFSGDYNDLTNQPQIPQVPTNVSAFSNDAGYITANDVPLVPTNVSAFTNDAGYITMDSIPEIPTNVSAFTNDAGYVTESSLTTNNYITQNDLITNNYITTADIPTNVSAFTNDAGYITMDSVPTVPTNISAFANDAGYVTESSLTTNNYITQNDLITNNYVTEADIPTNVSAFTNDAGYITMDSVPAIPTNVSAFTNDVGYVTDAAIPTNISAFTNDAGYLTTATVQEAANIPTNVSAFTNDAGYITMDSIPAIPTVPTNVSAFVNDAGYVTESSLTTNNYITQNDLITNNYVTEADIPTNVSAFTNDAGYITMDSIPAIPTVPTNVSAFVNDAGYLTTATVQEAANIPTNVSAFTNDAGYITMDSIPEIPTNVSAFVNDAGYVTESTLTTNNYITQNDLITNNYVTEADIPTNVSSFTNDAGYITMDSIPAIPTVPTNVSAFTNDAGYITESTLTTNNYITQNDLITNNYVTEADIPTNVSAFTNDAGYITMDSIPAIPTVPTNVSAFVNDAGYLTQATVQEAANIPTNVSAFTNDANYITLAQVPEQVNADWNATSGAAQIMNKPAIPTVPTNVSAFTNDANYITSAAIPTNVSAFTNDANYITSEDIPAYQVLSISNDTIYLSNGGYAVLPAGFDGNYNSLSNKPDLFSGNYNDLTNKPTIPTVPTNVSAFTNDANYITDAAIPANVSAFTNDAGYITMDSIPAIPTVPTNVSSFTNDAGYLTSFTEQQILSISNDTIYLTGGSFVKLPAGFSGSYNDLTDRPDIPTIPTEVSTFNNDAGYLTSVDCGNINICDLLAEMQSQIEDLRHTVDSLSGPGEAGIVNADPCPETLTDIDGNIYNTVQIGQQCWMKENLRTTKYADNTPITYGGTNSSGTDALWYYPNGSSSNKSFYGLLYNWPAVMNGATSSDANPSGVQGVCPTGWHVPSDAEFTQLTDYVSSQSQYVCGSDNDYIAKALAGTTGWSTHTYTCYVGNTPSQNNSTGFSALPAGYYNGSYNNFGLTAIFWSATENASSDAWHRNLNSAGPHVGRNSHNKTNGLSVRCVKDDEEPCEPTSSTHNAEITTDQLPYVFGDTTFLAGTETGTYILHRTNAGGCDSTITLNLTVTITIPVFTCGTSTITDTCGNIYNTVQIGNQCWMKQNLRTTKYRNGSNIPYSAASTATFTPGYVSSSYGLLYDWNTATSGICPSGWHLPSDAEWTQLIDCISNSPYVCGNVSTNIAKALASTTGWNSSTIECSVGETPSDNNATGFTACPAGSWTYVSGGNYIGAGVSASFWTSTGSNIYSYGVQEKYYRYISNTSTSVGRSNYIPATNLSVRCVRD